MSGKKITEVNLPVTKEFIQTLKIGDEVSINGIIVTARDVAHKFMVEEKPEFLHEILRGTLIYHCGPVVKKEGGKWTIVAAGPTTSSREEPYQADVIGHYGVAGVIGKGGMGEKTLTGLVDHKAVYLHAIGGAGTLLAEKITEVAGVYKLEEFGSPEAFWVLRVKDFPAVVTMDSHGGSLHKEILERSRVNYEELIG